jgi:hypothetical protein
MKGSSSNRCQTTLAERASDGDAFAVRVEGTTGIQRAGAIGKAVELSLTGPRIVADPSARLDSVTGMSDRGKLNAIAGEAGSNAPIPRLGRSDYSSVQTRAQGLWAVGRGRSDVQGLRAMVLACIGSAADQS